MKITSVLVTGADGFVGQPLCKELLQNNMVVKAAVRSAKNIVIGIKQTVVGSIDADTDWTHALQGVQVVIHLAARVHVANDNATNPLAEFRKVNVDGTLKLAREAANAGVKRLIFISSIKVNGEQTEVDRPFTEDDIAEPKDNYGLSKYEAEQGLLHVSRTTRMEVVIIRPPLVYGEGVKANFASMLRAVRSSLPLPLGRIQNQRSLVYVGNLISLIVRSIQHPKAANQIFMVSDGCALSTTELLQKSADALEVKARLLPVPQKLVELFVITLGRRDIAQRLFGNLQVDISKAYKLLDWQPLITTEKGLKMTALDLKRKDRGE